MMYTPDVKSLVFSELNFISTVKSVGQQAKISMDAIFDEVSDEIFALFVGAPAECEITNVWGYAQIAG